MPKKVLIALPPAMLEQVDFVAMHEHRTRSDLIREALRRYLENFKRTTGGIGSVVELRGKHEGEQTITLLEESSFAAAVSAPVTV